MAAQHRTRTYIKFTLYLAVIILINIAGRTLFYRLDLTENKIYSISEASKKVVSTLSEPLTINVFFTKNLPAPYNGIEQYLRDLIQEYDLYAGKYFNYRFYDVSPDEGDINEEAKTNRELATNYGIYPVQVQNIEKDEVKFQKAYMGLVIIHGDMIEKIPTITSTERLEYKLTTAIQKLNNKISAFLNLDGDIQIKLIMSSSLKKVASYMRMDDLPRLPDKLETIVNRLNDKNYGKLEFTYLDPTQDPSLAPEISKYNIMTLNWPELSDGAIQPGEGAIGLVLAYGKKTLSIPLIHVIRIPLIGTQYSMVDMNDLEETINENLESLIDINEDIGYVADHGTYALFPENPMAPMDSNDPDSISVFRTLVSQNYTIRDINLKTDPVPESLNCLIIARPVEKFTDYELFQLDQFLMRGKSIALFLDSFNEVNIQMQQPSYRYGQNTMYVPVQTGLETLLSHYGIDIKKSYVMDENCFKQQVPQQFGGGERQFYFAPIIKNTNINNDIDFLKTIKGLVVMKISPLEIKSDRIKDIGVDAVKLFSSSEKSWEMSGRIELNPMLIQPPRSEGEFHSYPLAYILKGEFPSYFAGKPIPEKTPAEDDTETEKPDKKAPDMEKITGEGSIIAKGKPGQIFLMASADILTDKMLDENGASANSMFIMNVIDYLNNRNDTAVMRSKIQTFNPLFETSAGLKTFIKSFNIVGLPVIVIIFGLIVWSRRQARKKRIKLMFNKS